MRRKITLAALTSGQSKTRGALTCTDHGSRRGTSDSPCELQRCVRLSDVHSRCFFRICSDGTLRGPEGSLVARYTAFGWQLGGRGCREFEALGPLFLRANLADGRRERLGPYEAVRAADGALFDRAHCLGIFCPDRAASPGIPEWQEITLFADREDGLPFRA
jgi:hypothetical protein